MLESAQVARVGFEQALTELEMLGLVRPANVLLAEYLAALRVESVLDDAAAVQISAAYNRVRYSAVADDDPELQEAVASLSRAADAMIAMSAEDRRHLARRVEDRLPVLPTEPILDRDTEYQEDARTTPVPPARRIPKSKNNPLQSATVQRSVSPSEFSDPLDAFLSSVPSTNGQRSLSRRVLLELSAVAVLAAFFGGYFFRDVANQAVSRGEDVETFGPNHLTIRDAWKDRRLWTDGVRSRADEEVQARQYAKARLALELLVAYEPKNPSVLNDLARLYLTPDESGGSNPRRALTLVQEALKFTRVPTVLATAAEAHFQCGNVREAIHLEEESLTRASQLGVDREFRQHLQKQLQRFQEAEPIRTAASPNPSDGPSREETAEAGLKSPIENGQLRSARS
jgi:tetratricopeptide (TPR) repeat protein